MFFIINFSFKSKPINSAKCFMAQFCLIVRVILLSTCTSNIIFNLTCENVEFLSLKSVLHLINIIYRYMIYGGFCHAPIVFGWMGLAQKLIPGSSLKAILSKVSNKRTQ